MSQVPPPPAAGPSMRPPLVTAAAVLLFIVGALNLLSAFFVFGLGTLGVLFGILGLAVGAAAIYAGAQILAAREIGRTLGMAVAAIGLLFGIYYLTQGIFTGIIGMLLNIFILYALYANAAYFRR